MRTSTRTIYLFSLLSLLLSAVIAHADPAPMDEQAATTTKVEHQKLTARLKGQARMISSKEAAPLSVSALGEVMLGSSSPDDLKLELSADLSKIHSALPWVKSGCHQTTLKVTRASKKALQAPKTPQDQGHRILMQFEVEGELTLNCTARIIKSEVNLLKENQWMKLGVQIPVKIGDFTQEAAHQEKLDLIFTLSGQVK